METRGRSSPSFRLRHFSLLLVMAANAGAFDMSQLPMFSEQRLVKTLLQDYQPTVRPYFNISEPVHTSFGLSLVNILELNEVRETLDTYLVVKQSWHDGRLQWNSSHYQGITQLTLPPASLWTPDIVSYDNVESDLRTSDSMVLAYASGHLIWMTPLRLRTTCRVNLRHFPFDEQTCSMHFASWVYNGHQVNLTLWGGRQDTAFTLESQTVNKEWSVQHHSVTIHYKKYTCCPEPYPDLVVTLTLKRDPEYHVHVFVVPALLLGLLVPFHVLLPPDSSERMTLGSILLASQLLLILKLQDVLPSAHSQLPAIGLLYTLNLLWSSLAMVTSVLVVNLHSRGPRHSRVPDTIRWVFLRSLKRLVCLGSDSYCLINDPETISMRGLDHNPQVKTSPFTLPSAERRGDQTPGATGDPASRAGGGSLAKLEREAEDISRQLHAMASRAHVQEARAEVVGEWRMVALVVDRVLFFVFFVVYLLSSVIVLG